MRMGIERKLMERIPEILEVQQVEPELEGLELTDEARRAPRGHQNDL